MRRYDVAGGTRFHVRVSEPAAEGPPVVLVHGFVISSRYLVPLMRELAPRCPSWAPDLPGFGRSEKPRRALDVAGLADALAAWMEGPGPGRATLVGNSFGCQVIVELAARRPDLVARAVLVGPTMDPSAGALAQAGRLLLDAPRERLSMWLLHVPDYARAGVPRALRTYRHALADPVLEKLPRVAAPTLVVRGERDPIVTPAWAQAVARALPRGRLATLPGAHALNYSRPRPLAEAILRFLPEDAGAA